MKKTIRFVRSMSLLLALVLLFTMSPLSVIAVSGADAEETTAERGAPEMSSPTSTPTEGTPAENGLVLVDEAIHFLDEKAGGIRELTSLREESVKHFALTNGKYAALTYPAPVHRKDRSGVWQDIDNNLSLQSVKNVQFYATSDLRVVFSQDLASSGQLFSLNENGYEIGMSMDTAQLETGELLPILPTEPSLVTVRNAPAKSGDGYYDSLAEAAAVNNAASIRYSNVKANTDLEYVLTGNAVKENIIVKARGTSYVYRFTLTLSGLTPTLLKSGVISLNDTVSGARKYIIPAPFMYDAAGNRSEDVAYALTKKSDGTYLLTVTASAAWINESDRAFPVTIDPTIYQHGVAEDTYINNNYPEDLNGSGYSFIVSEEDTAYVRIALPELPENAVIDTASMYLIKENGYGSVYISARQVLGDWDEYEMTPSYAPAYSSTTLSAQTVYASSGTYFGFNITSAARAWLAGTANNYGIAFVGSAIVDEYVSFQASDVGYYDGNDMAGPYLYVEYSEETSSPEDPPVLTIPEGVYSFQNLYDSKYMSVENSDPCAGAFFVSKSHSGTTPTAAFARESLFKLSHVSGNTYILRSMLNNNLTLGVDSDGNVITKAIPSDDDDVSVSDTFVISSIGGYYQIIPRDGSSSYIGTSGYSNYLAELDYSDYSESDQIKWTLTQYTGQHAYGANFYIAGELISGRQITITPTVWYTSNSITGFTVEIPSAYANIATGIWNPIAGSLIVFLRKSGIFISTITFIDENGLVQGVVDKTISVASGMHDGIVHTFYNTAQQKLIKPNGTTSLTVAPLNYSDTSFMFMFEYAGEGYYKIRNESNGYYLRAQPSNTSGAIILQSSNASGNYALWRFTEVSEDTYLIQSKNQYLRETSTPLYLAISGSTVVQSSSNTAATWIVKPLTMNINVLYDQAFVDRFGVNNYENVLHSVFSNNSIGNSYASVFKERFGILVKLTFTNTSYQSFPYTQNCTHKNSLDTLCNDCKNVGNDRIEIECRNDLHHKSELSLLGSLPNSMLYSSTQTNILFTGFQACYASITYNDDNSIDEKKTFHQSTYAGGWAYTNGSAIIILTYPRIEDIGNSSFDSIIRTTTHETLHTLGAGHCDKANFCVMNSQDALVQQNLTMCDTCRTIVNQNKIKLYNH